VASETLELSHVYAQVELHLVYRPPFCFPTFSRTVFVLFSLLFTTSKSGFSRWNIVYFSSGSSDIGISGLEFFTSGLFSKIFILFPVNCGKLHM